MFINGAISKFDKRTKQASAEDKDHFFHFTADVFTFLSKRKFITEQHVSTNKKRRHAPSCGK